MKVLANEGGCVVLNKDDEEEPSPHHGGTKFQLSWGEQHDGTIRRLPASENMKEKNGNLKLGAEKGNVRAETKMGKRLRPRPNPNPH